MANDVSILLFVPVTICFVAIVVLLNIHSSRQRQRQEALQTAIQQIEQQEPPQLQDEELSAEESDTEGGSSTTTSRVKKVGKKRGEKLRRKEQMRQYREYLDQQREMQRAQDLILEEQYRERRAAEQIKQFNELEALRKQQAKQAKKEQKERDAIQKQHEKQEQNDTRLFDKYNIKIKDYLQKHKIVRLDLMAKQFWLQRQQVDTVVQKLFKNDPDFKLCLWSDDGTTVMYVQPDDYRRIGSLLDSQGKLNAQACVAAAAQTSE